MGAGFSAGASQNIMRGQSELVESYKGNCPVTCTNITEGTVIILKDTTVNGIKFTQKCTANAQCMFDVSLAGLSKMLFNNDVKQKTKNASGFLSMNFDLSESYSEQDISQSIRQSVDQTCSANTANIIKDVTILAENSDIGGDGIIFDQSGNATAACAMNATTKADLIGQGTNTVSQVTGGNDLYTIIAIVVAVIVVGGIAIFYLRKTGGKKSDKEIESKMPPFSGFTTPVIGPSLTPNQSSLVNQARSVVENLTPQQLSQVISSNPGMLRSLQLTSLANMPGVRTV